MRFELKAIKKQGILSKVIKRTLFAILFGTLFYHLSSFGWSSYDWTWPKNVFPMLLACLLVFANWFFEWLKWKHIAKRIELTDQASIHHGFLAGIVSGFITPNALGNFVGRMAMVHKGFRSRVVTFTVFANGSQFLMSLLFGMVSVLVIDMHAQIFKNEYVKIIVVALVGFIALLYFTVEKIPLFQSFYKRKIPSMGTIQFKDKAIFLLYSLLRYSVFSFQFFLILVAFQPNLDWIVWIWIWNLYLWTTLSPSLVMGKLVIRESLAIMILTQIGVDLPVALMSSLLIWTINNALPSIYAYFKIKDYVVA